MYKPVALSVILMLLLFAAAPVHSESADSAFTRDLELFKKLDLKGAVKSLDEFNGWSSERQLAFLFATSELTEGQEVGAYRLYFHARASISTDHVSRLIELLKSTDARTRMYSLLLLDIIRPPGIAPELFRIAAFDPEGYVGMQASKMLGFYGLGAEKEQLRRIAKSLDPDRLSDLIFRYVSTSNVKFSTVSDVVAKLPPSPTLLAIMAATSSPDTFDIAASSDYSKHLLEPWLWQVLAQHDPTRTCQLFGITIAKTVSESDIADYLDPVFQIAGLKSPEAAYEVALLLKASGKAEAYIRALSYIDLTSSLEGIRKSALSADTPLDKIQRLRYLVDSADYASLPDMMKLLMSDEVKRVPRRQVWCATMLSYFFAPAALTTFEKARAESKALSARASALGPIARISPTKGEALISKDIEQFTTDWTTAWNAKLEEDYSDTISDLYNAFLSIMAGIAELPPDKGLPLVKKMAGAMDPWFLPEIFSATGWWCGDTATCDYLSGHAMSKFPHIATAAANMLGFVGTADNFKSLAAITKRDSLATCVAIMDAEARLACVENLWGTNSARAELVGSVAEKMATAAKSIVSPEDFAASRLSAFDPSDDASWKRAAEIIAGAGDNSALALAVLRLLQSKTGVRFAHLPDYSPYFQRHDVLSAIKGNFAARKAIR